MKTTEEKIAVMQAHDAGKPIECRHRLIDGDFWKGVTCPVWNWQEVTYRIALTKPSIDWSHVAPDVKWLAEDEDGEAWLFFEKPTSKGYSWVLVGGDCFEAESFASYVPGTCPWDQSLVQRPEGV